MPSTSFHNPIVKLPTRVTSQPGQPPMSKDDIAINFLNHLKVTNNYLYRAIISYLNKSGQSLNGLGEGGLLDWLNTLGTTVPAVGGAITDFNTAQQNVKNQQAANELAIKNAALQQTQAGYGFANSQAWMDTLSKMAIPLMLLGGIFLYSRNKKRR